MIVLFLACTPFPCADDELVLDDGSCISMHGSASSEEPSTEDSEPANTDSPADSPVDSPVDSEPPLPDEDYWEAWPKEGYLKTYCSACHPTQDWQHDWQKYEDVVDEYDHIYCGTSLEMVDECGLPEPHHEPGHLPQGDFQPTTEERLRMLAWMDAGMPKLEDLQ